jgi:invasion protein IalB
MTDRKLSAMISTARSLAAAAIAVATLCGVMLTPARAQLPMPPPAAQKPATATLPAPAAPSIPQAQAAAPAPPDLSQLIYTPWAKFCDKSSEPNAKKVCSTASDLRFEDGRPFIAAMLIEPEGEPKKVFRIALPMSVQLRYGARIAIDKQPALSGTFLTCVPGSCVAEFEGTADLIGKLKKGQLLNLQAVDLAGNLFNMVLPLSNNTGNSFAKANEGPPTDPKVIEEQQQRLQKRAEEARKRLQSQGGAATGATR